MYTYYCEWSITRIIENCILCEMAAYPLIKIIDISRHNSADSFFVYLRGEGGGFRPIILETLVLS